jgi:hypothetical protein
MAGTGNRIPTVVRRAAISLGIRSLPLYGWLWQGMNSSYLIQLMAPNLKMPGKNETLSSQKTP